VAAAISQSAPGPKPEVFSLPTHTSLLLQHGLEFHSALEFHAIRRLMPTKNVHRLGIRVKFKSCCIRLFIPRLKAEDFEEDVKYTNVENVYTDNMFPGNETAGKEGKICENIHLGRQILQFLSRTFSLDLCMFSFNFCFRHKINVHPKDKKKRILAQASVI
jgi:hypothetical protein